MVYHPSKRESCSSDKRLQNLLPSGSTRSSHGHSLGINRSSNDFVAFRGLIFNCLWPPFNAVEQRGFGRRLIPSRLLPRDNTPLNYTVRNENFQSDIWDSFQDKHGNSPHVDRACFYRTLMHPGVNFSDPFAGLKSRLSAGLALSPTHSHPSTAPLPSSLLFSPLLFTLTKAARD